MTDENLGDWSGSTGVENVEVELHIAPEPPPVYVDVSTDPNYRRIRLEMGLCPTCLKPTETRGLIVIDEETMEPCEDPCHV